MSLPSITAPSGTPPFLAYGHGIEEDSVFANVKSATGHGRKRRVYTVPERVVQVSWFLDADELEAVEDWYENTLQAGSLEFAAQVANQGPGLLWWTARWVDIQYELLHFGRARVTGSLFLTGEGSETGPDTSDLAMEVVVALIDIRSKAVLSSSLAMEVVINLVQPLELAIEVEIELGSVYESLELREVGGFELREDGGKELR